MVYGALVCIEMAVLFLHTRKHRNDRTTPVPFSFCPAYSYIVQDYVVNLVFAITFYYLFASISASAAEILFFELFRSIQTGDLVFLLNKIYRQLPSYAGPTSSHYEANFVELCL